MFRVDRRKDEEVINMARKVVWFSCGAASAVTAKLAVKKYGKDCLETTKMNPISLAVLCVCLHMKGLRLKRSSCLWVTRREDKRDE